MSYLIYPIALYLIVVGLRYLMTFLQLRKLTLQYAQFQIHAQKTVPDYVRLLFQAPIAELKALGFKPCCYLQVQPITKFEPPTVWELLFFHPQEKTYAEVSIRLLAEPANLFQVTFYNLFCDRSFLITMNAQAYGLLGEIPRAIVQDPYAPDWSSQWQTHQTKLTELNETAYGPPPKTFVKELQTRLQHYLDGLVETKVLTKTQPGEFQLRWSAAFHQTVRSVQGNQKVAKLMQVQRRQAQADSVLPIELEVQNFQRMEFLQRDLVGRKFRTWLLLGSLAIFLVSYMQVFNAGMFGLFIAALLLHEAGHLLAMKGFGYRNLALLFLPFLGALATAHKEDASLSQKFWISLAGPLPGLLLGIGLAFLTQSGSYSAWVSEASWILIGLNLFNLLPIYPLDGGQIADLLLFSRHPYLGVIFKMIGVLLLGLLGLQQPVLLIFAALIAWGIPASFRVAKVSTQFRKTLRQDVTKDRTTLLHLIFAQLQQMGHGKLPFVQRYTMAKALLQSQRELHARRGTRVALGLVYSLSLFGGIFGTLQALLPEWSMVLSYNLQGPEQMMAKMKADRQHDIDQATAALQKNPDDIQSYRKRAEARLLLRDHQGVLADYDQLVRLQPQDIPTLLERARYRVMFNNSQGAIQDYARVLQLNPKEIQAYRGRAQAYTSLENHAAAIADYDALIRLTPNEAWDYLDRGFARQAIKDYQGAIADANQALEFQPKEPDAYRLRSEAKRELGDAQGALADQEKAKQLYETVDN